MASCINGRVGRWWKHFVIILAPLILLLPLLLVPEEQIPAKANQCLYVMLLMAMYWVTEALSLAVTACIPIFLFPMLGILTANEVCSQFLTAVVMMFVGGLMVALAVEKCNLHKRIAIGILHVVGTKPLWLMLGFMAPTAILSMWISNTATTAMMLPICEAVLESLVESHRAKNKLASVTTTEEGTVNQAYDEETSGQSPGVGDSETKTDPSMITLAGSLGDHPDDVDKYRFEIDISETDVDGTEDASTTTAPPSSDKKTTGIPKLDKFAKGMTLAICYAANTGGTATLIGTPPNAIMKGFADDVWKEHGYIESPVTFSGWIVFGLPTALICIIFVWLWLTIIFNGFRSLCPSCTKLSADDAAIKQVIDKAYNNLGRITYAEVMVSLMFLLMVLLWFFRTPSFMVGWANTSAIQPGYTHDCVVSIFVTVILCILPSKIPTCKKDERGSVDTLLDWHTIQTKLPWGIIFLIGGGFCLAKASTASGLSAWIAEGLQVMAGWPGWVLVFVICLITAFLTEITSNSATCTILMPIVANLAESAGYSPLYLMMPVALSTSFAFMLPVATPPNAIAFSYDRLRIIDMVKAGFILNFLCVGIVTLAVHTWGEAFFGLSDIPWDGNSTTTIAP